MISTRSPSGSTLDLFDANFVTDRGEIVARGFTSNGDVHTAILIPDGEALNHTQCGFESFFPVIGSECAFDAKGIATPAL